MARLKIKSANSKDPQRKRELLSILSTNEIYVTRIITTNDGFVILTFNEEESDKVFKADTIQQLQSKQFNPITPPQLKANRSVLLFRVENFIFSHSESEIKEEIINHNDWVEDITQIYKFPNSNTLKITFQETAKAQKALELGIKMFLMRISPHTMQQDTFLNLMTCMKCYMVEDHSTRNCPKEATYKVCSCCSSNNHTWQECTVERKTCINCQGEHVAVAMQCPVRKEAMNKKRKDLKETKGTTYAAITKLNSQPQISTTTTPELFNMQAKTYSCMLYALFMDSANEGSFQEELDAVFEQNGLPKIKVPKCPPSRVILGLPEKTETSKTRKEMHAQEEVEKERTTPSNTTPTPTTVTTTKSGEERQTRGRRGRNQTSTTKLTTPERSEGEESEEEDWNSSTEDVPDVPEEIPELEQVPAEALGLQIMTRKSLGWPSNMKLVDIIEGIENKIFKWTHTKVDIPDEVLYKMLKNNEICLDNCFFGIEDSHFRKMRNGLVKTTPVISTSSTKPKCKK